MKIFTLQSTRAILTGIYGKNVDFYGETLKDKEITATVKQIGKKLADLKNYYRGQKRMIESSKSSGAGGNEVYVSPFYNF